MATGTYAPPVIVTRKTAPFNVGASPTQFAVSTDRPVGYLLGGVSMAYGNSPFILGGIEAQTDDQISGFLQTTTGAAAAINLDFVFLFVKE